MTDLRIAICLIATEVLHYVLSRGLEELPQLQRDHKIEVAIVEPPPQPPPEPPKEPEPEPKQDQPHEQPKPQKAAAKPAEQPKETPPPVNAPATSDTSDTPIYGVSMESTSTVGNGPVVPIGNTTRVAPDAGVVAGAPKPLPEPVAAFEATKMPLPEGRCTGKYTDDARAAGIEGTVVLDLIVAEDGHVREVDVVQKLGHGLDEAAIAALRACKFSPGEKDGKPVPVKIRGFKIQFVLAEAQ